MEKGLSKYFSKVFFWMFIGLALTGLTAFITATTPSLLVMVLKLDWILLIVELALVIAFSSLNHKVTPFVSKLLFAVYSIVSGLTCCYIFSFSISALLSALITAVVLFAVFAVYGALTKQDLTKLGSVMIVGLISVLIGSIINLFIGNGTAGIVISVITVVLFLGLTAYDIQKIKRFYYAANGNSELLEKCAIHGALQLYLDFINIFLSLLNLGRSRD